MTATAGNGWVRMRMDALTINAVDAAGRAVMSEITREHLAGLKIAHDVLSAMSSRQVSDEACMEIERLAMKARAAPEQEPVAWGFPDPAPDEGGSPFMLIVHSTSAVAKPDELVPLYRHADTSEVERLRSALQHIIKTVGQSRSSTRRLRWIEQRALWALDGRDYDNSQFDLPRSAGQTAEKISQKNGELKRELGVATQRADATERKLVEVVGLLRDAVDEIKYYRCEKYVCERPLDTGAVEALLSASAEPADQPSGDQQ